MVEILTLGGDFFLHKLDSERLLAPSCQTLELDHDGLFGPGVTAKFHDGDMFVGIQHGVMLLYSMQDGHIQVMGRRAADGDESPSSYWELIE